MKFVTRPIDLASRAFQRFFRIETRSGALLLVSALAALAVANSPWGNRYEQLWQTQLAIGPPGHALVLTIHQWIDDVLMALFFLLVGLEIKRELISGELSSTRQAALPIAGAIGGMVLPALIYITTPSYIEPLFTVELGNLMLIGCGVWMSIGIFVMKKMVSFKY